MNTTPDIPTISKALATALNTVPGLRAIPYLADNFVPPVALVAIRDMEFQKAYGDGDVLHVFEIHLIVSRASERAGIELLEGFMSQAGNIAGVHDAIVTDQSLGGVVSTCNVESAGPPGAISVGGVPYLWCPFVVHVHA